MVAVQRAELDYPFESYPNREHVAMADDLVAPDNANDSMMTLHSWLLNPPLAEEDGESPTVNAIVAAASVILGTTGLAVMPDGDGGIIAENRAARSSISFRIARDGTTELVRMENHRVVQRAVLPRPPALR